MKQAYIKLHQQGYAHSFEAWQDDKLVGGLYGIALDQVFFGESMFSNISNASKICFACAVQIMQANNIKLIDCQVKTSHLQSLGAIEIPRSEFVAQLRTLLPHYQPVTFQCG